MYIHIYTSLIYTMVEKYIYIYISFFPTCSSLAVGTTRPKAQGDI